MTSKSLFFILLLMYSVGTASALSGWNYSIPLMVGSNNTGLIDGHQINVHLQGTNPTIENYIDFSKLKVDGTDLRITDIDGVTPVDFWVESWNSTDKTASIWIKAPGSRQEYYKFNIDPELHNDYGLSYPVTYEFSIPAGSSNLAAYKKYIASENWIQISEKTSGDFFNGIEAARFDYTNNTAYLSVPFDANSDSVFLKITDNNNIQVGAYQKIDKYYDNRKAAVVLTADDWGDFNNNAFLSMCTLCANGHIWFTPAIVTNATNASTWSSIQAAVNNGYVEPASHSRTHPSPLINYDSEIGGSKADILNNLIMPALNQKGSTQYVYAWTAPEGQTSTDIRMALGQYKYLEDTSDVLSTRYGSFPGWDYTYGLYDNWNRYGYAEDLNETAMNTKFDTDYAAGNIYHLGMHPSALSLSEESAIQNHLNHIKDKNDVWYAGMGHIAVYNFAKDRLTVERPLNIYYGNKDAVSASSFDNVFTKDYDETGLLGLWHIDSNDSSVIDSSGNSNNGTLYGATKNSFDGGQWYNRSDVIFSSGSSIHFVNDIDYVDLGNSDSLNIGTSDFSIEFWYKPSSNPEICDILTKINSGVGGYAIAGVSGKLLMFTKDYDHYRYTADTLLPGQWYLVDFTKAGSNYPHIYINGVLNDGTIEGEPLADIGVCSNNAYIGKGKYNTPLKGDIDEIRIASYAYTQDEILSHYQRRLTSNMVTSASSPIPLAFSSSVTYGNAPLTTLFRDDSTTPLDLWQWDFENDGIIDSTEQNPTHEYKYVGNYSVNLTIHNDAGYFSIIKPNYITVVLGAPVADFVCNTSTGAAPLTIQFNDTSYANPEMWLWDFGDGNNSTEQNPVHTYSAAGNYSVNLTVSNANGTSSKLANISVLEQSAVVLSVKVHIDNLSQDGKLYEFKVIGDENNSEDETQLMSNSKLADISVSEQAALVLPVANFSANATEGFAPLSIQFTDSSENATSVNWDFGDGGNSVDRNPIHEFITPGIYTVNLTASNENGTSSKLANINVSEQPAVVLSVKARIDNLSQDGKLYEFKVIGDESNSEDEAQLMSNSKLANINVSEQPAVVLPVANFSANTTEGFAPLSIQFTDSSENATSVNWDFGDGGNSEDRNPIHEFTTLGIYTVNLTASNENGKNSKLTNISVSEQPAVLSVKTRIDNFSQNTTTIN